MCRSAYLPSAFRVAAIRWLILALGLSLVALPSAAMAAPATADVRITVLTPLSFVNSDDLDFGRIIPANVAGTVNISTNNVRTATNGITLVGTDFQAARFGGMGTQNQRVRIRISTPNVTLTGPGPAMTVTNLVIGAAPTLQQIGNSPNYRIVPANGIFSFTVGADLAVGANQPAGTYSGTFTAIVDYQ